MLCFGSPKGPGAEVADSIKGVRHGVRRLVAWLVDWACILVWVAVTAAVGVPLYLAGVIAPLGLVTLNVIGGVVIVVPVVTAAAWAESRFNPATPGKRLLMLSVRGESGPPRFGAALARNAVKIGLPWLIGHAAVFAIVASDSDHVPVGIWILTGAAYVLPLVWVVSLFVGDGRTPYDRMSGTRVVSRRRLTES